MPKLNPKPQVHIFAKVNTQKMFQHGEAAVEVGQKLQYCVT